MTALAGGSLISTTPHKTALRRALRNARRALSRRARRAAAQSAARHLLRLRLLRRMRRVALYVASGAEIDPAPLAAALRRRSVALYLPRIVCAGEPRMRFIRAGRGARLRRNRHGIPEPCGGRGISPGRLDLVLIPLLGFDIAGRRLGSGVGYYDRALACVRHAPRPLRMGYAFALQGRDEIPGDVWDVPLHAVCTERGMRRFPRQREAQ